MLSKLEIKVTHWLHAFIQAKVVAYQEPSRVGTHRGEPIGLSRRKYHSALLCMTDMSIKDIAGIAGVSYGLLRKWRTENAFRDVISKSEDEFILSVHIGA